MDEFACILPESRKLYGRATRDEIMAAVKEHLGQANHVRIRVDDNDPEPRYFAEYKIIPMVLDAESKAYAKEILDWGEKHGYDVAFMDEEKVRDICERIQPAKLKRCGNLGQVWYDVDFYCEKCGAPIDAMFNYCSHCGRKIDKEGI